VLLEGEFVAQLNLAWKGEPTLAEGGLEFLSSLGSHLAVVLKNARLYEQLDRSDAKLLRTQDELIQSAKLAAVGELAAGVAHELNNPLTGILGYTQWVLLEVNKTPEQEPIRTRLEKIEREVLRCKEIVQNLLNFSRTQDRAATARLDVNAVVFLFYLLGVHLRHSHVWLAYPPAVSQLLISPAMHQIHHSTRVEHYDKNFGLVFSVWDRLFGTLYVPETKLELTFGLGADEEKEFSSVARLYVLPFRKAAALLRRSPEPGKDPAAT
jgi:signal transduction histidine kinase